MQRKADGRDCLAHSPRAGFLRIWLHERTRPDATIGMDFSGTGGAAFCRRQRARTDVHAVGRRAGVRGGAARDHFRHRVCGRPSCRDDRRADRRALWHAAADAGGHHHRSRFDRDHHARRQAGADIGAGYGVRGRHDRVQRPGRHLHLHRGLALPRAGRSGLRRQPLSQRAVRDGDHHADHAQSYADGAGAGLFGGPAWLCQRRHPSSLRRLPLHPDHPPSRLFHQWEGRRRG